MIKLKNNVLKTLDTKVGSIKGWRMLFALALVVSSIFAIAPTQWVLADAGGVKGHTFIATYTKMDTSLPANPLSNAVFPGHAPYLSRWRF